MPEQQSETRVTVDLPVRIWGMNAAGRPFSQYASAHNISSEGAKISGVESVLAVGDVIGVQCDDKKARCTVIWVINTGPLKKNEVGVKLLAEKECPWKNHLPVDGTSAALDASNRRRFHRHKISLPLEIRDERVNSPIRMNATDVSGNGCYIESMQPLARGVILRVDFWIDSQPINITAVVRTCDPGVGNGIEFTGMPPESKELLQRYLDTIDPELGVGTAAL